MVNSTVFNQIIDKMPGEEISFISKQTLLIKGKLKATIPMYRTTLMNLHHLNLSTVFRLRKSFLNCSHALAKKDEMNGLFGSYHIEVLENGLRVTALDGKRISICSAGEGKVQYDFVVAGEFLKEAIALSDGKAYMEKRMDRAFWFLGRLKFCKNKSGILSKH